MKRNFVIVLVVMVVVAILCVGFYGYLKSPAGKYYVYNEGDPTSTWIELTFFGKWEDSSGSGGKYEEKEDGQILFRNDKNETVYTGEFKRGVITMSGSGAVYCRKNHTHTLSSKVACRDRICTSCGETIKAVSHKLNGGCVCEYCGEVLHNFNDCVCSKCKIVAHNYVNCVCTKCGDVDHNFGDQPACKEDRICLACRRSVSPTEAHDFDGTHACVDRTCSKCGKIEYASEAHDYGNQPDCQRRTCSKCGLSVYASGAHDYVDCVCTKCGDKNHNYVDCVCTKCGRTNHAYNSKCVCVYCGYEKHSYGADHLCAKCGKVDSSYVKSAFDSTGYLRMDSAIYFGTYPQTQITDKNIIASLSEGGKPSASNANGWTPYGYYKAGDNSSAYMWYIDKDYGDEKYRGIYFTSYRPTSCESIGSTAYSNQDDNGYTTYTAYWFRYEPIKWVILAETDGYATLLADLAIDSQAFYHSSNEEVVEGDPYANNYAASDIRTWLNETFYNTAFTNLQKGIIQTVTVDNSEASTTNISTTSTADKKANKYACENTEDNVWLLSHYEIFREYFNNPGQRTKGSTDYAKAQGCYRDTSNNGNCKWWLRSPYHAESTFAQYVYGSGEIYNINVSCTEFGVVPAVKVKLG